MMMGRKFLYIFLIMLIALFVSGCGSDTTDPIDPVEIVTDVDEDNPVFTSSNAVTVN